MASVSVPIVEKAAVLDEAATPGTAVRRDSQGNIVVVQASASELKSTGTVTLKRTAKTSVFTAGTDGYYYACDATSAAFAANLPPAATVPNRIYVFKKIDSSGNAVTVTANGAETIEGSGTVALSSQWAKVTVISNGSNWEKLA